MVSSDKFFQCLMVTVFGVGLMLVFINCISGNSKPNEYHYELLIMDKKSDFGTDYNLLIDKRNTVTKYHIRYKYRVVADGEYGDWSVRSCEVDCFEYDDYEVGKTYVSSNPFL